MTSFAVEYCPHCKKEYLQPVKKFNGGNPVWVSYPDCTCEEDRTEMLAAIRLMRRRGMDRTHKKASRDLLVGDVFIHGEGMTRVDGWISTVPDQFGRIKFLGTNRDFLSQEITTQENQVQPDFEFDVFLPEHRGQFDV